MAKKRKLKTFSEALHHRKYTNHYTCNWLGYILESDVLAMVRKKVLNFTFCHEAAVTAVIYTRNFLKVRIVVGSDPAVH